MSKVEAKAAAHQGRESCRGVEGVRKGARAVQPVRDR